ncbi:MAG: tetratricopeptide (TPR) repeat protein [Arenicella sp.]|jgi:tetratricopeptide (TPR) repeat protein
MKGYSQTSVWKYGLILALIWPAIFLWNLVLDSPINVPSPTPAKDIEQFINMNGPHSLRALTNIEVDVQSCSIVRDISLPSNSDYELSVEGFGQVLNTTSSSVLHVSDFRYSLKIAGLFLILTFFLFVLRRIIGVASVALIYVYLTTGFISISIILACASIVVVEDRLFREKNYSLYLPITDKMRRSFEVLSGWAFKKNVASKLHAFQVNQAISESLRLNQIDLATEYAEYDGQLETLPLREASFLLSSQKHFLSGGFIEALRYAQKARLLSNSSRAFDYEQKILSAIAVRSAKNGQYEKALGFLREIDPKWDNSLLENSWLGVSLHHIRSLVSNSEPNELSEVNTLNLRYMNQVANTLKIYIDFISSSEQLDTLKSFFCLYVGVLQEKGKLELSVGDSEQALKTLEYVESFTKNAHVTIDLLTSAYHDEGIRYFDLGDTEKSIKLMSVAYIRNQDNTNIRCALSILIMDDAVNQAYQSDFSEAYSQMNKATSLCRYKGIDQSIASIALVRGEAYMRYSEWELAKREFVIAKAQGDLDQTRRATNLIADFGDGAAEKRHLIIEGARAWVDGIPRISGSICSEHSEEGVCLLIDFYKDEKLIGKALPDMSEIQIEVKDQLLVLKDAMEDGRFDTAEFSEGAKRRVIIEKDGDHRLDRELLFDEKGTLVADDKYSGRILLSVPGGTSGSSRDFLSSSDSYLIVKHNNSYIGHTNTAVNTQFPTWREGFVIDYKRNDQIAMWMYDDDSGNVIDNVFSGIASLFGNKELAIDFDDEDDLIDSFVFNKLPESKLISGENGEAAIELKVVPTSLPPGVYDIKSSEYVNTFRHADFGESENKKIADIKRRAHIAEKRSEEMATLASWTLPEVATMTIFRQASLVSQIIISLAGSEVVYDNLKNDNVINNDMKRAHE